MNKITKGFLVAAMLVVSVASQAQFRFGPQVGLNVSSLKVEDDQGMDIKSKIGLSIGAIAEYGLGETMALQSGLIYSSKGSTYEESATESDGMGGEISVKMDGTVAINYLEIPVNFKYYIPAGSTKVILSAGPYVAFAMGGKYDMDMTMSYMGVSMTENESEDLNFGSSEEDDFSSTDFGLNLGAGIEIKNFVISAQYGLGLKNIDAVEVDGQSTKNNNLSFSVAYMFGGK